MINEKRQDMLASVILLSGSFGLWAMMRTWPAKSALYPKFILGTISVFSVILLLQSIFKKDSGTESALPDLSVLKRLVSFIVFVVVYAALIPLIGWVVSSSLYICYYVKRDIGFKPRIFALVVICLVIFRIVLTRMLYITMPSGVFGLW